jgi:NADH dehydrogenase FAD-containing subunit
VKPAHFDALTFTLQPVLERKMGVKFIWGEVKELIPNDSNEQGNHTAKIKPMFTPDGHIDTIKYDYCVICSGCNFNPLHQYGESLWFATIHEKARPSSSGSHIDERFIEGRRRHILEEYDVVAKLAAKQSKLLIVGAGFIGVEWCTEIDYYFQEMEMTIMDLLPRCLGPLPDSAADYCSEYMDSQGIREFYNLKYNEKMTRCGRILNCQTRLTKSTFAWESKHLTLSCLTKSSA